MVLLHEFVLVSDELSNRFIWAAIRTARDGRLTLHLDMRDDATPYSGSWSFRRWIDSSDWSVEWEFEGNGNLTPVEQRQIDDYLQRLYRMRLFL